MYKVMVTQSRVREFDDNGKYGSYEMHETIEFDFDSVQSMYGFITTCMNCGKNIKVEITKEED